MAHVEQPKSECTEIRVSQAELALLCDALEALVDQAQTGLDCCSEEEQPDMAAYADRVVDLYSALVVFQRA